MKTLLNLGTEVQERQIFLLALPGVLTGGPTRAQSNSVQREVALGTEEVESSGQVGGGGDFKQSSMF